MERYSLDAKYHAYIFGDSSNDLAMFEYTGIRLRWADMIQYWIHMPSLFTKTVENDGIAYAMKHYGSLAKRKIESKDLSVKGKMADPVFYIY